LQQSEVTSGQLGISRFVEENKCKDRQKSLLFGENVSRSKTSHLYSGHEAIIFKALSVARQLFFKALPVARQELPPTISHFKKRDQNQI
jgi:hypothetical protein